MNQNTGNKNTDRCCISRVCKWPQIMWIGTVTVHTSKTLITSKSYARVSDS